MFTDIIDSLKSILQFLVDTIINLVQLIIEIPAYLSEAISAAGGVFSLFASFFSNIPDQLWLGLLLSSLGIFLSNFLYGKINSKGGE